MRKGLTELVFILDRSGSMAPLTEDTIGGFNAMIREQKEKDGECLVTTVLFDNTDVILHDRIPLPEVPVMSRKEYSVRGCTALLDAVGHAVQHISDIHRYARPDDVPEKTLFVITTDGMENASHHYSHRDVKRLIEQKKEEAGWEFIFVAANIDAAECAQSIGISRERAVNYRHDQGGTRALYESVNDAVSEMREAPCLSSKWRKALDRDNKSKR